MINGILATLAHLNGLEECGESLSLTMVAEHIEGTECVPDNYQLSTSLHAVVVCGREVEHD